MIHIHFATTNRNFPAPSIRPDGSVRRWDAFLRPRDNIQIDIVQRAIDFVRDRIIRIQSVLTYCDAAFQSLPRGQSFQQIFNGPAIWISRNLETQQGLYGTTSGHDITIAQFPFTQPNPALVVAATLVHEMAHINGARGGNSSAAERTLLFCGFGDQYQSNVVGVRDWVRELSAMA